MHSLWGWGGWVGGGGSESEDGLGLPLSAGDREPWAAAEAALPITAAAVLAAGLAAAAAVLAAAAAAFLDLAVPL